MKIKHWVVLLVIISTCIYLKLLIHRNIIKKRRDKHQLRIENKKCPALPYSLSPGLINDAVLLCECLNDWDALNPPTIHIEKTTWLQKPHDWIFVNMDFTNWFALRSDQQQKIVFCKLQDTFIRARAYLPQHSVLYSGFTSFDLFDAGKLKNFDQFLHTAGKSPRKGTRNLIRAWLKHPEWPRLIVVCREDVLQLVKQCCDPENLPPNIHLITEYVSSANMKTLMNESGVHVCPSQTEGFGHYANEARSTASLVLYSDGPALQELFDDTFGIPIKTRQLHLSEGIQIPFSHCSPENITDAVLKTLALPLATRQVMGQKARQTYLVQKSEFEERFRRLATRILRPPSSWGVSRPELEEPDPSYVHWVNQFLLNHNIRNVLELGCGEGKLAKAIDWKKGQYFGVDQDSKKLEKFQAQNPHLSAGSVIPVNKFFDFVLIHNIDWQPVISFWRQPGETQPSVQNDYVLLTSKEVDPRTLGYVATPVLPAFFLL